ncbi:MAG: NUDIX hydrolase [Anaerolineae bacterium]|nr:NUDIX hydrolase [Anaerolineae bacterium]
MDIETLINPEEIKGLAKQYGPIERRSFSLERSGERCEHWRRALAQRRGEVIFVVERPAGLILHTKDTYPPGIYRLPSGGVSWGESVLSALHREVREEMGLEIEVERFLGLLEYEFHCQEETLPFVSYVFLVRGDEGEPVPQGEEERILSFRQVSVAELAAVADSLRAVEKDWRDWGEFRAIAHDFVVEKMGGIHDDDDTPEIR